MRFRHKMTGKNTIKRVFSFLLMLCLLVPMLPSSIGLEAKAEDDTNTTTGDTVTIKLHDLYIDRKEALPDGTDLGTSKDDPNACLNAYTKARSIIVKKGTTLRDIFAEAKKADADSDLKKNTTLGTSSLAATKVYKLGTEDNKAMTSVADAKDCVWYTRGVDEESHSGGIDGNNPRKEFNSDTEITEDIDLYTYSYRLRLVTGAKQYSDLIVREGQTEGFIAGNRNEKKSISDFLASVDGTWTDINSNTAADTSALTSGLTRNYILRQSKESQNTTTLTYYAAVDGEWQVVKIDNSFDLDRVDVWGRTGPALNYYVTDDELQKVYGTYGFGIDVTFEEGEITKQKNGYFPYANGTGANLYIRQMPKYETVNNTTQFRVPLIEDTPATEIANGGLAIYYTPHNTTDYDSRFLDGTPGRNGWASPTDSAVLKENSFYTVSVDDADKDKFNTDALPNKDKYYLYGSDAAVTLPLTDKNGNAVKWYVEKGGDNVTIDETTGKVTVKAIDKQLVLTTDASKEYADDVQVHCFVLVNGEPKEIGRLHTHATQQYDAWGDDNNKKNRTRYYVTAEQAETVFGEFGFKASKFDPTQEEQKYIFANTTYNDKDSNTIWTDAVPTEFDGVCKIPLANSEDYGAGTNKKKDVSLYYIPNNTTVKKSVNVKTSTAFQNTNSFYSITFEDPENKLQSDAFPKTKYVLSGDAKVTIPAKDGVEWYIKDASTEKENYVILTPNGTTTTVSVPSISHAITLTTKSEEKSSNHILLHCYVVVDEKEVEAGTLYFSATQSEKPNGWGSNSRYFVSTQMLEKVYKDYGFDASEYNGERYFPCTIHKTFGTNNRNVLWADTPSVKYTDTSYYKIPLLNTQGSGDEALAKKNIDLFYTPNGIEKDSANRNSDVVCKNNTFYSITANDEANQFSGVPLPDTQYALTGTDKTITLPYKEGVSWYRDQNPTALEATDLDTDSGTAKYTISGVVQATTVTTKKPIVKDYVDVSAYISKDGEWTEISSMTIPDTQHNGSRYYLTSENLETLFGACGFQPSDYANISEKDLSKYFPSGTIQRPDGDTGNNYAKIWTDAEGKKNTDRTWQVNTIGIRNKDKGIAVYYVPNIANIETGTSFSKTDEKVLADNQFYTITFKDPTGDLDANKIPSTMYRQAGQVKVTLPYAEGITWTAMGKVNVNNEEVSSAATTIQKVNADKTEVQLTITVNTSLTVTTNTSVDKNQIKLVSYVAIDGTWQEVDTSLTTLSKLNWDSTISNGDRTEGRFYITAEELETIYGQYGFESSDCKVGDTNTRLFAVRTKYKQNLDNDTQTPLVSDNNIWVDQLPKASGGSWYLPLIECGYVQKEQLKDNNIVYLYYLPKNTSQEKAYFKESCEYTDAKMTEANSFYTVTCKDPSGQLGNTKLPDTQYILRGESRTIEVPYVEGVTWHVTDKNGVPLSMKLTRNGDKMTLGITNADQALVITTKSETDKLPENAIALNAYVAIDDEWVPVYDTWTNDAGTFVGGTLTISKSQLTKIGDTNKYFITVKQLENIYGQYGFSAEEFDNVNHFPHNTITSSTNDQVFKYIYADGEVIGTGSSARIPLIEEKNTSYGIAIYYTPKYTPINEPEDKKDNKWEKTDKDCLKTNSVKYTVSVDDPNSLLSAEQKLPEAKLYDRETKVSINLPSLGEGKEWIAVDANTYVSLKKDAYEVTPNSDGTVNATINSLTQKVTWIPVETPNTMVKYDVGLAQTDWQDLGKIFPADEREQTVTQDGMIRGKAATYLDYAKTGNTAYNVLQPDYDYVKVRVSIVENGRDEPRDFYYTFKGWHIVKNGETLDNNLSVDIQPGQERTLDLNQYSNASTVVLKAVWKAKVGGNGDNATQNRPNTVNFYLSTDCEIMDNMSNGFQGQAKGNFTRTIYSTRIYGTGRLQETGATRGDFQVLAPADNASTAYSTDRSLRDSVTRPIVAQDITDNIGLTLESFPSDEEILDELKNRVAEKEVTITLEGESIQPDELTTENFAVRWYVLKYHGSDAWHIDGVLVAKEGHAVVTKTFIGDKEAIAEIKQNYFISVTHQHIGEEDVHDDYTLTLTSADQETGSGKQGYTHYDEGTDTYIWVLTGRQGRTYTVTENNYLANSISKADTFDGTYQYMIENSSDEDVNTNGWKSYTRGVQLKAEAYANDAPEDSYQTLSFQNIYVQKGLLSVAKIDAATGRGLANVNFTIKREDGKAIQVLQENDTRATTHKYEVQAAGTTYDASKYTKVDQLTTDANGYFYISLPIDTNTQSTTYVLTETLPVGYDGPTELEVTVSDHGQIQHITEVTKPDKKLENNKPWVSGENTAILTINNYSKILLTVTAQKKWDDSVPADERKPVRVELWRNGVKMTDTANQLYTQTLDESNSWTYTWNDLPLYVDGEPAQYSLHEVQIGDVKYDLTAGSNGYKDYVVSYDPIKYLDTLGDAEKPLTADWSKAHNTAYWDDGSKRVYAQHALLVVTNSKKPSDIFFKKTDGLGNPLEGALFGMYADKECKQLLSQSKSDANGQVQFVSRDGDMYIKEISAPDGCTLDTTVYQVVTDASGKKILQKVSDSSSVETIANLSHINLLIQKVDNNDKALTGAEFTIEKLDSNDKYQLFGQGTYKVNSEDGIVRIVDEQGNLLNFDEGKYRITETKTPGDLYRNAGSIIVTVQGGQVYYEKSDTDTDIDSWTMERRANTVIYTLQVVNSPWYALPSTGNFNPSAALAALLGAALMCGASALALWLRKKRGQNTL